MVTTPETEGRLRVPHALEVVYNALRLAGRFVVIDPTALASQLLARIDKEETPELAGLLTGAGAPHAPVWLRPLGPSLARTDGPHRILSGHNNSVSALATTPDGRLLVSASWDRTIGVWNLEDGRLLRVLQGHDEYVEAVVVTVDGTRAASGSVDGTVRVWDLHSGTASGSIDAGEPVVALAVHPDGGRVIVASPSRVSIWSLSDLRRITIIVEHQPPDDAAMLRRLLALGGRNGMGSLRDVWMPRAFVSVAVAPDGRALYTGRVDGELTRWDKRGRERGRTAAHDGPIWAITPTPDGSEVVTGGQDGTTRIWVARSGDLRATLKGTGSPVNAVAVTPDGSRVVTGCRDATVRAWDRSTGAPLAELKGHSDGVYSLAVSPDGALVTSGSEDRTIRVWACPSPAPTPTGEKAEEERIVLAGHEEGVMSVARIAGEDERVVSASQDRTLKIWDLATGMATRTLSGHTSDVLGVATTPDGRLIVSAGDTTVRTWDTSNGNELAEWDAHGRGGAFCVAVVPPGDRVLSGGADRAIRLWDLATNRKLAKFRAPAPVLAIAVSPDGQRALAGTEDGTVLLLDLIRGTAVRTGERQPTFVRSVAFTRDGRWAVAGAGDGVTRVWDPDAMSETRHLGGDHGPVGAVLELADRALAVSYIDGTVVLWNLESGQPTSTIQAHDGPIGAMTQLDDGRIVTASGDTTLRVLRPAAATETPAPTHTGAVIDLVTDHRGDTVISASEDRTVRVWDLRTGEQRAILGGTGGVVRCAAISPNGRTVVAVSADGMLTVWDVSRRLLRDSWQVATGAHSVRVAADGRRAVLGGGEKITVVDLEQGTTIREIASSGKGTSGYVIDLAVSDDDSILVLEPGGSLRAIDLDTGSERARLTGPIGHDGVLFTGPVAVEPGGRRAASVAVQLNDLQVHDNPIRVWDLVTGGLLSELRGHTDWVRALTFAGQDRLISAGQDGMVRVWDLRRGTTLAWFGTDTRLLSVAADPRSGDNLVAGGSDGSLHFLHLETDR